ncbi:hypothetical protein AB0J82_36430 [Asanoa sp. NPDC049518]|uniref:hypothetical protein n=1 Tax=unclassified Asanoa TaxID=2685164 RepID=UPI0034341EF4
MTEQRGDEIDWLLRGVDWTALGADPTVVTSAFRHLRQVGSREAGQDAYDEVLDAIGHNHSGWLFDAAGPAATILVAITRATRGWARRTAIEILIDCLAWVRPEQRFVDSYGRACSVDAALVDAIESLEAELRVMAADADTTVPVGKSATDLLKALREHEA